MLLQLERRADEEFRAHQLRVWRIAHPETAASLEEAGGRISKLQSQLGSLYEQIRSEHAQAMLTRAQISARTAPPVPATSRADALLEEALSAARQNLVELQADGAGAADEHGADA